MNRLPLILLLLLLTMEEDFELPVGASLDQKMDLLLRVNLDLRKTLAGTVKQLEARNA